LAEERNERWVLVALAVLAVAYVVYRYRDSIDIDLSSLAKPARSLGYFVAPLLAVLTQIWKRRKTKAAREGWEKGILQEGLVRRERGLRARLVNGKQGGAFPAEVSLTRAALYLFDDSGRRDPMRFPLLRETLKDFGLSDVRVDPGGEGGQAWVRIRVTGPSSFGVEFLSAHGEHWWVDVRRAIGKSADLALLAPDIEYEEED
jgi:hypothetical protein